MKESASIYTWHLHITGQVQGVGFRPTVYRIAQQLGLVGQVKNETDGLHVLFNASQELAKEVQYAISRTALPPLAVVSAMRLSQLALQSFTEFSIVHGCDNATPNLLVTPDVAICNACRKELLAAGDRRNNYAFNSCSQCGPRYSIIERLPYDRITTAMSSFELCASCAEEYSDPADRRYYAQTISCNNCAIGLHLYQSDATSVATNDDVITHVPSLWEEGKIVAIKGIGGYLLTCDAKNKAVIARLRTSKHRPTKPLAMMYPNLESLDFLGLSEVAKSTLDDHISPILLSPIVNGVSITRGICDAQDHVGVMLPYAPLFKVLLNIFQGPIVATSGNRSNTPIIYQDENVFDQLSDLADYILTNDRGIVVPQDDSIVKYSEVSLQKIIVRRSRGLAPTFIDPELTLDLKPLLATGAQYKSTFTLYQAPNVYISQYLGDLDSYETMANYEHCLQHLTELLQIQPTGILADRHPGYASTQLGKRLADQWNVPITFVPHHQAHACAILGEHNLIASREPILAVIWDGAGLGDDDMIWGGEFFKYDDFSFIRCSHLAYFDLLLGDKMAKEPRISALSLVYDSSISHDLIKQKFTTTEWRIYTQKIKNGKHLKTSSIGRLFDAVASILGLNDRQSFEGEAPMLLEVSARSFFRQYGLQSLQDHYLQMNVVLKPLSGKELIRSIVKDLTNGIEKNKIAAKFHLTLVKWIKVIASQQGCTKIACSGGAFQNSVLIDLAIEHLSDDYDLYFHEQLSPNDENVSFGQLIYQQICNKRLKMTNLQGVK